MNCLISRRLAAALLAATAVVSSAPSSLAQPAAAADETKGVLLDEPESVPAPTPVGRNKFEEKYADGTVRVQRDVVKMSDDQVINDGQYTEFYPNGKKFAEGTYVNGAHDGAWSFWYDNGQLAKTVTFKNGQADGAWEVHRPDGSLQSKKGYKGNLREGSWVSYYEDGKTPKIEQTYVDSKLEGPRKTYFANGKIRQDSTFKDGVIDGLVTEWDDTGRKIAEATFAAGKLNGKLIRWGADGTTFEQTFRDNKLIGKQIGKAPTDADRAKFEPAK